MKQNPASNDKEASKLPDRIGRYRVQRLLGKGGFGLVYLAMDEQLDRLVAIKVPHAQLISKPEDAQAYLSEARTVAALDHPNIVPVFDVGSTEDYPCFVVSKYIEGTDLSAQLKHLRFDYQESAVLVAILAEALHYAHKQGVVHRDVKPSNILIGIEGKPFLVDFGLALRDENVGKGPRYAGTPAYMSPEQARGEGHRVDGRSDTFSLGVVLYELLAGRRPFQGDTETELFEQVTSYDPRPIRQYDDRIPKELERICSKAMTKRASERYSTAKDFAEDLRLFLREQTVIHAGTSPRDTTPNATENTITPVIAGGANVTPTTRPDSAEIQPIKIVPKGLRSFDAHDSDFFLELLAGARDREGLPESIRFWKTRIEETDADNTFSVGVIYGPSGCGKSSLVKAGLLPRLSSNVIPVYLECTGADTEIRILNGLHKRCPAIKEARSLKDTLTALRRGRGIPTGKKVLIVLDQFEQWLHAKKDDQSTELVQALRQCDGGNVQCLLMVRDDFWMAVTRFMRELEVRLVETHNSAAVDLFPIRHAEKVLAAFGRAFGNLHDDFSQTTKEQNEFVKQSVFGLSEEGKVVCVRLALFAEMMKGKMWTPTVLKEVGGTKGVGVNFLEETFSASTAPPDHRYHQKAARAVLKALLPDGGSDIRGTMRSYAELLEASGYGNRPSDFNDLIRILDGEIRLITPTDPEGKDVDEDSVKPLTQTGQKYFQLTHDYLVHSLRDWLTRKQKETRKGRAELKLFDASVLWNATPRNRFLPTLLEWINIRALTEKSKWTIPQCKMMSKAGRYYGFRVGIVAVVLFSIFCAIQMKNFIKNEQDRVLASRLINVFLRAEASKAISFRNNLSENAIRKHANNELEKLFRETNSMEHKYRCALTLLPGNREALLFLKDYLMTCPSRQFSLIINWMNEEEKKEWRTEYWSIATSTTESQQKRFRAACVLASFDSKDARWKEIASFLSDSLVNQDFMDLPMLVEFLRPIGPILEPHLQQITRADGEVHSEAERLLALEIRLAYSQSRFFVIHESILEANPRDFVRWFQKYETYSNEAIEQLRISVAQAFVPDQEAPVEELEQARLRWISRQANAAVALMRLEDPQSVYQFLTVDRDPEALSQFIYRIRGREVSPFFLMKCLAELANLPVSMDPQERQQQHLRLYSVILGLGEFKLDELPINRESFLEEIAKMYGEHPSRAVHSALGWLLRRWGQEERVRAIDETPLEYDASGVREWYVMEVEPPVDLKTMLKTPQDADRYSIDPIAPIYFTMLVFPGGKFEMGEVGETETVEISGPIAVSDREVTWRQFSPIDGDSHRQSWNKQFKKDVERGGRSILQVQEPVFGVNWLEAVNYCRWLTAARMPGEENQSYAKKEFTAEQASEPGWLSLPDSKDWEWPMDPKKPGFRLLTEREWEYVARGGMETTYSFGTSEALLDEYGWYDKNSGGWSHPTAMLRPSVAGLFDIHGNLSEWTNDSVARERVARGGNFTIAEAYCKTTFRNLVQADNRTTQLGFRIAVTLTSDISAIPSANK